MKTKSFFARLSLYLLVLSVGASAVGLAMQDGGAAAAARRLEKDFYRAVELLNSGKVDQGYDLMVEVANEARKRDLTLALEVERGLHEHLAKTKEFWRKKIAAAPDAPDVDDEPAAEADEPEEVDRAKVLKQISRHYRIAESYVKEKRYGAARRELEQLARLVARTKVHPEADLREDIDTLAIRIAQATEGEGPVAVEPVPEPDEDDGVQDVADGDDEPAGQPDVDRAARLRARLLNRIDQARAALNDNNYEDAVTLVDQIRTAADQGGVTLPQDAVERLSTIRETAEGKLAERRAVAANLEERYANVRALMDEGKFGEARQALIELANDATRMDVELSREVEVGMRRTMAQLNARIERIAANKKKASDLIAEAEAYNNEGQYGEALETIEELDRFVAERDVEMPQALADARAVQVNRAQTGVAAIERDRERNAQLMARWGRALDRMDTGNYDEALTILQDLKTEGQKADVTLPEEIAGNIDGRIAEAQGRAQQAAQAKQRIDTLLNEARTLQEKNQYDAAIRAVGQARRVARDNDMELQGDLLARANAIVRAAAAGQAAQKEAAERRRAALEAIEDRLSEASEQLDDDRPREALETLKGAKTMQANAGLALDDATTQRLNELMAEARSRVETRQAVAALQGRLEGAMALRKQGRPNAALDALESLQQDASRMGDAAPEGFMRRITDQMRSTRQAIERMLAKERERKIAEAMAETLDKETLRAQIDKARARKLVEEARALMRQADYAGAREKLQQAARLDPENPEIANELNALQAMMGREVPDYEGLLEEAKQRLALRREQTRNLIRRMLTQARKAEYRPEPDFDSAMELYKAALERAKASQLPAGEKRDFVQLIEGQMAEVAQARQRYAEAQAEAENRRAIEQYRREHEVAETTQEEEISRIFAVALKYVENENYDKALDQYDRVLRSSPTPDQREKAMYLRNVIRDLYMQTNRHELGLAQEKFFRDELIRTAGLNIAWHDTWRFPEDWMERSRKRIERVRAEEAKGPASQATLEARRKLQQVSDFPNYENQPIREIVNTIRERTGVNIHWSYNAREYWDVPISNLALRNTTYEKALRSYLDHGEDLDLDFLIRDGLVWIATKDEAEGQGFIQVYDILDIVVPDPDYTNAPSFDISESVRGVSGSTGGSDDSDLFNVDDDDDGGGFGDDDDDDDDGGFEGVDIGEESEKLQELLRKTVRGIDYWDMETNSLRIQRGRLMVMAPRQVQEEIQDLLRKLRQIRNMQVIIDLRNIFTTRYFAEVIGIEWEGPTVANPNPPPPTVNQPGVQFTNQPVFGNVFVTPFSILNGATNAALQAASSTVTTAGLSANNGLLLTGSILDDVQLFFLIRAVQGSTQSRIMTAPRVTVMNGQLAYMVQARTQDYIANTGSVPASGGGAATTVATTNAVIGRLQTGTLFQLRPTVSWDRRYVKVDLVAHFTDLLQFRQYTLVGPPDPNNPGQTLDSVISQPELQNLRFRTTVSVPDRGTVIVGGVNQSFQSDMETGVPILGKLPILGRLFTSRGQGRDKEVTILLVRPEILIQEERDPYEQQLGANM